jgi:hypothetical protein
MQVRKRLIKQARSHYHIKRRSRSAIFITPAIPLNDPVMSSNLLLRVKRKDGSFFRARIKFIAEDEAVLKPVDELKSTQAMAISLTREK